jgi:DNA-binding NarL/FixJ family response regulator
MPKILLVDDHEMMLESLSLLVSTIDDMEVVAQLSDSRKVVGFLRDNEVDILVTDYTMPYINGVELALELKPVFPTLKILMLTVLEDVKSIKFDFVTIVDLFCQFLNSTTKSLFFKLIWQ